MRDRREKAAEVIDNTRMTIAELEGKLTFIRETGFDIRSVDNLKEMIKKTQETLKSLRKGLNQPMFENDPSPFGFDLRDWKYENLQTP